MSHREPYGDLNILEIREPELFFPGSLIELESQPVMTCLQDSSEP